MCVIYVTYSGAGGLSLYMYVCVLRLVESYRETALSEADGTFMNVQSHFIFILSYFLFVSGNCSLIISEHRVYYCYKIDLLE